MGQRSESQDFLGAKSQGSEWRKKKEERPYGSDLPAMPCPTSPPLLCTNTFMHHTHH